MSAAGNYNFGIYTGCSFGVGRFIQWCGSLDATLYLHSKWEEEEYNIHSAMDMNKSISYLHAYIYIC